MLPMPMDNAPLSPAQRRWRVNVFAATWLSYAGFYFCRKAFSIVKVPLRESLQIDDYQLAHLWTAYLLAYMIGQFLSGWLGSKIACRRLLLTGMGLSIGCNIAFGTASLTGPEGYWPLFIFMILNGFAQSTGWPGNVGTMAHWFRREERGTVMGFWATCYQLGSVGAKAFAAFMVGWLGVAWSFWGASVVLFAVWILFYFMQRDQPEDLGLEAIVVEIGDDDPGAQGAWTPAVTRTLVAMGLAYFSFKFLRYGIDSWTPMLIEERFEVSTAVAGYVSTAFDWVGFTGVIFAGWASDRFFGGRRAPLTFFMACGMVGATVLLWRYGQASIVLFGCGIGFIGFMLFGPDSLLSGVGAIDVGSKRKAVLAAGIVNGIGSAGPPLQEQLIGYLKTYHSLESVFILLIGVATLGAVVTGGLYIRGRVGVSRF